MARGFKCIYRRGIWDQNDRTFHEWFASLELMSRIERNSCSTGYFWTEFVDNVLMNNHTLRKMHIFFWLRIWYGQYLLLLTGAHVWPATIETGTPPISCYVFGLKLVASGIYSLKTCVGYANKDSITINTYHTENTMTFLYFRPVMSAILESAFLGFRNRQLYTLQRRPLTSRDLE